MPQDSTRPTPPTLTAWVYDSSMGAAAGEVRLRELRLRDAVTLQDAVTVTWVHGAHRPRIGHLRHDTNPASPGGSVLGALAGRLLQPGPGTDPAGQLADHLTGSGVDRAFLEELRTRMTPGSSTLLVLALDADLEAVRLVMERGRARGDVLLLYRWLTPSGPRLLREALSRAAHP